MGRVLLCILIFTKLADLIIVIRKDRFNKIIKNFLSMQCHEVDLTNGCHILMTDCLGGELTILLLELLSNGLYLLVLPIENDNQFVVDFETVNNQVISHRNGLGVGYVIAVVWVGLG